MKQDCVIQLTHHVTKSRILKEACFKISILVLELQLTIQLLSELPLHP